MAQTTYVAGLRETQRALVKLGADAEELKDAMADISDQGADVTRRYVPVATGRLRATVRGNRAKARATVTVGRGRSNAYAPVVNYGWEKRNIRPANYVEKTDAEMEFRAPQILDAGMSRLIQKYGLD